MDTRTDQANYFLFHAAHIYYIVKLAVQKAESALELKMRLVLFGWATLA